MFALINSSNAMCREFKSIESWSGVGVGIELINIDRIPGRFLSGLSKTVPSSRTIIAFLRSEKELAIAFPADLCPPTTVDRNATISDASMSRK
jgi:hypothetical protein